MSKFFICLLLNLFFFAANAQQESTQNFNSQIELQHDNDFILLTDYYYSSGLYLSYRFQLKNALFSKHKEQLELKLSQEIYTPKAVQSQDINVFDRSYAGFLGLTTTWTSSHKNHLISAGLLTGIVGPNSGAGGFQRWYHNALVISDSPIWQAELEDSFHINLYAFYVKEWQLLPNPFGIYFAVKPSVALGSRDIFAEHETIFYFGRKETISKSVAFNQLGNHKHEVYFSLNMAYRRVFYNGLIEGNLFGDNSAVIRDIKPHLIRLGFDFHNRFNRHHFKLGVRYNSAETTLSDSHKYLILSYAYSFNSKTTKKRLPKISSLCE